jgi:hypothetical protein
MGLVKYFAVLVGVGTVAAVIALAFIYNAATGDSEANSPDGPVPPSDQISTGSASWVTAPPWDCKGTPPAGYISQYPGSSRCVVVPAPTCAPVSINGKIYCGPERASYTSNCGPGGPNPCRTTFYSGESSITWLTDAAGESSINEWKVQDSDTDSFADLHRAFYEDSPDASAVQP